MNATAPNDGSVYLAPARCAGARALGRRAWPRRWHGWRPWPSATAGQRARCFALTLCADEALTNVVSYAQAPPGQPQLGLRLECGRTPYGVALRMEDDGAAFDPTAQEPPELAPSLDDALVGGHGLRLMRHYLHTLHYQRQGERNVLLLGAAWAA